MQERNKIASYLLEIKAVNLNVQQPYTWSSGWRSPIYCDNRKTLSYPAVRRAICDAFVAEIRQRYPRLTGVAGVATGAIAHGVLVAHALELPFIYVRSSAKGHGLQNLLEGEVDPTGRYVVIEDLISTGKSSVQAVKAIQQSGATVLGTLAIFSYGFRAAEEAFSTTSTHFHTLTNLEELLQKAVEIRYLHAAELDTIRQWQQAPEKWGRGFETYQTN
ncbi:MAG: orotate phosphoribosyltransferase [Bacteroidetes bacterium]|nr:MAG: orotate phosphoribosyltransferase [Bacteroidota bacterium]